MTLPDQVLTEAEWLTRLAREAVDPNEADARRAQRDELLAEHGYVARVRSDDTGDVLVCHPAEWLDKKGNVDSAHIEDVDRGVEVPLEGPGDPDDWDEVDAHNRSAADRVEQEHGPVHGANAHAFADFMGNHYSKPVEQATPAEVAEFLKEYFPRNAWPSDDQRAVVDETVELVQDAGRRH